MGKRKAEKSPPEYVSGAVYAAKVLTGEIQDPAHELRKKNARRRGARDLPSIPDARIFGPGTEDPGDEPEQ